MIQNVKISSKNQITIPVSFLRMSNIKSGETLNIRMNEDGSMLIESKRESVLRFIKSLKERPELKSGKSIFKGTYADYMVRNYEKSIK